MSSRQSEAVVRSAAPAALAIVAGALYGSTLCRSVYWYDSAEYVTAAYTLGVPHPPGYPLYTMLAHAFAQLSLTAAFAVNAMSALAAVLALLLLYAVGRELALRPLAAAGAALVLATAPAFWFNATVAEVYTPGLCFTLGVLWLLLRARARRSTRLVLAAAALAGAGLGVHYSLATCGLGFAWLALCVVHGQPRQRQAGFAARCVAATLLGASVFVYVAVRGFAEDAVPNYGSPPTVARWLWLISGGNYAQLFGHGGSLPHHLTSSGRALYQQLGAPALLSCVLGVCVQWRRARVVATGLALCLLGNLLFFVAYGVDDREVFLLPAAAIACLFAAAGIDALASKAHHPALLILVLALLPAQAGARAATDYAQRDLSQFRAALAYGERVCAALPRGAVVLNYTTPAEWKYDAVFGMYMKHVRGRRPDVVVVKHAGSAIIDRLLAERRPLFVYVPIPELARRYRLQPAGDLLRVLPR